MNATNATSTLALRTLDAPVTTAVDDVRSPEGARRWNDRIERMARGLYRRLPSSGATLDVSDLVSSGWLGLLEAAERFDGLSDEFERYASTCVRGRMLDELRRFDPVNRRARGRIQQLERAERELRRELDRAPAAEELSDHLSVSLEELEAMRLEAEHARAKRLDPDCPIVDHAADGPHDIVVDRATRARVAAAVDGLPDRLGAIVREYYFDGATLAEIGTRRGFTAARACQVKKEALDALRDALADDASPYC